MPSRQGKLGFMDLPIEIRLQIYPHLLTATRHSMFPEYNAVTDSYEEFHPSSQPAVVSIDYTDGDTNLDSVHRCTEKREDNLSSEVCIYDEPLHTSILYTCKTIASEALPILYSHNTFSFWAPSPALDDKTDDLMFFDEPRTPPSTLSMFLRQIGSYNASHIRHLDLAALSNDDATSQLTEALPLALAFLPKLRNFTLHIREKFIDHDDEKYDLPFRIPYHDDNDPFWANGPFRPLFRALRRFLEKVCWLHEFYYDDFGGQWRFEEEGAFEMVKGLEKWVGARKEVKDRKMVRRERTKRDMEVTDREEELVWGFWPQVESFWPEVKTGLFW
ncbi:MAG: hypothetical protein Q9202_006744 [Teloschistes flavicans]